MDADSPFATFAKPNKPLRSQTIHVLYCVNCHYVWKAPAEAHKCVNCVSGVGTVYSLVNYASEIPIT